MQPRLPKLPTRQWEENLAWISKSSAPKRIHLLTRFPGSSLNASCRVHLTLSHVLQCSLLLSVFNLKGRVKDREGSYLFYSLPPRAQAQASPRGLPCH